MQYATLPFTVTAVLIFGLIGCRANSSPQYTDGNIADIRERFLATYNATPSTVATPSPELRQMAEAYMAATIGRAHHDGELDFIVVDESGQALNEVSVEYRIVTHGSLFAMEPNVRRERTMLNGGMRKKWPSGSGLEIDLAKAGYRVVKVALNSDELHDPVTGYERATQRLFQGYLLPPREENGPVRIVMPPALVWEPHRFGDGGEDRTPGRPDLSVWPKRLVPIEHPVISSNTPRSLAVDKRGTYVLIDKDGEVLRLVQIDRGNVLGLFRRTDSVDQREIFVAGDPGGSGTLKPNNPPYQWQLFAEPVPRRGDS